MAATTPRTTEQPTSSDTFFPYFQSQVTDLQTSISRLETLGTSGGERADAVDHCLASIARLSNEVKDASSYLPAYDQRTYGEAIKALQAKLQDARASFAPRPKFAFKKGSTFTARKNESAISLSDLGRDKPLRQRSSEPSFVGTPVGTQTAGGELEDDETVPPLKPIPGSYDQSIRKPSFSQNTSITLSNHDRVHIMLPASAGHATNSGTLSYINRSVVDMSSPTRTGQPFATLTLKNVRDSLIVCGHVSGAAHLTSVTNSIIVVRSRQFRMHESKDCDVYLHTSSRPIVEDCSGIRFAPLPELFLAEGEQGAENQWDQVDDFKWLKSEPSPNWQVMKPEDRLAEEVWRDEVPGRPGKGVEDVLEAVGMGKRTAPKQ